MLCFARLCYASPSFALLCFALLCYAFIYFALLCFAMLDLCCLHIFFDISSIFESSRNLLTLPKEPGWGGFPEEPGSGKSRI